MKIVFLGTNGWYTNQNGNTACILIDSDEGYVILDAGNGIYKVDDYIKEKKPIFLFISHFHLDHVSGVHTLPKFEFRQGIDVYVGSGRRKDFETLVNPPYTIGFNPSPKNVNNLKTKIRLHELSDRKHNIPFPVTVIEQFHAYRDHGYRIELEGKTIAYSGDCGISETTAKLATGVDLLIHECSFTTLSASGEKWGHVTAERIAEIARKLNVGKLILTHFDPTHFPTLESRNRAGERAKKFFSETIVAKDDYMLTL